MAPKWLLVFLAGVKAWFMRTLAVTQRFIGTLWQVLETTWASFVRATLKLRADVRGFINMGSITSILTVVVVGIVILLIIAALAPTFITAIADLVNAVESGDTNNTTANSLLPVFGLLIALGGVFALVGYAFLAYRRSK